MAYLLGLGIGAIAGAVVARLRGGNRLDMLHYAGVFALIGLIVALFFGVWLVG